MFGFSRGAFTARFLARMINNVGLLCKGNEEMVPFAYRLYQRYLAGEVRDLDLNNIMPGQNKPATEDNENDDDGETKPDLDDEDEVDEDAYHTSTYQDARNEIVAFSDTFCRKEHTIVDGKTEEVNVKVYFLGLWDCVNSVAVFEKTPSIPVPCKGNATYVRHAVAVDERRVKFKPALLAQDVQSSGSTGEDIKEVWFPGCHGDVGGGWPASSDDNVEDRVRPSFWQNITSFFRTRKPTGATRDVRKDAFQMSDVALSWMIRELELVSEADPKSAVKWSRNAKGYKTAFKKPENQRQALKGFIHDSLAFGQDTGFGTVLLWKFMGMYLRSF